MHECVKLLEVIALSKNTSIFLKTSWSLFYDDSELLETWIMIGFEIATYIRICFRKFFVMSKPQYYFMILLL